tara:strand:- start:166 stop:414 length:249 start_codon:yes stop_codon:yes gene_type:complete
MSERIFTIEMIDMDLADLDTDEFLGLTPTYLRSILLELKRCYEKIDWLQQTADLATDNIGRKNWDVFEEAMYEAGLWERPSE